VQGDGAPGRAGPTHASLPVVQAAALAQRRLVGVAGRRARDDLARCTAGRAIGACERDRGQSGDAVDPASPHASMRRSKLQRHRGTQIPSGAAAGQDRQATPSAPLGIVECALVRAAAAAGIMSRFITQKLTIRAFSPAAATIRS
jgi:hypothetical protein